MSKLKVKDFEIKEKNGGICNGCHFEGEKLSCVNNILVIKLDNKHSPCSENHIYVKKPDYKAMFEACEKELNYTDQHNKELIDELSKEKEKPKFTVIPISSSNSYLDEIEYLKNIIKLLKITK
jgi:hypothetical protein